MALFSRTVRTFITRTAKHMQQTKYLANQSRRYYQTEIVLPNVAKSTAEGPIWLKESKTLMFVDNLDGDIVKWDSQKNTIEYVHFDTFATFVVPHPKGGFVAGVGQQIIHFQWNEHRNYKILAEVDQGKPTRLVDGKCDKRGRLFAATMGLEYKPAVPVMEQGSLYSLDTGNKIHMWDTKLHIANSMCWSPNYDTLYLTESIPGIIYAYDYDLESGSVSNRRVLAYLPHMEHGVLDRMTVDTDGNLWTAYYGGGKVTQIDPRKGEILRTIKVNTPTTTCVTFGGDNYEDLYVTSSSYQQNLDENPHAGSIFRITGLGARGMAPNMIRGFVSYQGRSGSGMKVHDQST